MKKKKAISYVIAGAMASSILVSLPAFAAEDSQGSQVVSSNVKAGEVFGRHHGKFQFNEEELIEKAKELGIDPEGKETRELAKEVMEAGLKNKAKELGIETEGKDLKELAKEVREAVILQKAKELGIEPEGKEFRELKHEVMEASVLKAAKELGIDTEGKSTKEIMREIMTDHAEEAKELDIFPFNKEEVFFFHGGKRGYHGHGHGKGHHDE